MNEKEQVAFQAQLDQTMAFFSSTLPPALRQFYNSLCAQGFTAVEAIQLTTGFMNSVLANAKNHGK